MEQKIGNISNSVLRGVNTVSVNDAKNSDGAPNNGCLKIFFIANIFLACINFFILAIGCPRTSNLGFDYMGVIVAVLGLLVAIMLGWNIYTAIDNRSDVSLLKTEATKLKWRSDLIFASIHSDFANIEIELFCQKPNSQRAYAVVRHSIEAIVCYQQCHEYDSADAQIKLLTTAINKETFQNLSDKQRVKLIASAKMVTHADKLLNYDLLMKFLYSTTTNN